MKNQYLILNTPRPEDPPPTETGDEESEEIIS